MTDDCTSGKFNPIIMYARYGFWQIMNEKRHLHYSDIYLNKIKFNYMIVTDRNFASYNQQTTNDIWKEQM